MAWGEVAAPIVIGRDHLDSGSVASPYRETEAMADGSDAIADWPILNALLNTASGASWVSVHHGGGVGIGRSIHAGVVVVADGTEQGRRRLDLVLTNAGALVAPAGNSLTITGKTTVNATAFSGTLLTAQAQAFGFAIEGDLQAFHRLVAQFPAEAESVVVHRQDVLGAGVISHLQRLFRVAVRIDVGVVRPDRHAGEFKWPFAVNFLEAGAKRGVAAKDEIRSSRQCAGGTEAQRAVVDRG